MIKPDYPASYLGRGLAPIYVQLFTIFRRFVANGEWPVGDQVPTHEQLASQFGVNTSTVRKAIGELVREGLVRAHRKRGTFVIAQPARPEWYEIPTNWTAALEAQTPIEIEALSIAASKETPVIADGAASAAPAYTAVRRLYRRDGHPLGVEHVLLDTRLRKRIPAGKLKHMPLLNLLEELDGVEIMRADETITFGIADRETANALVVPLNTPIAIVHQSVVDDHRTLVLDGKTLFRGDRVRIFERIKP